jgi:hypothetical protein
VSLTLKPKKNETSAKKKRHKPPAARQIARGFSDEENDNGDISDAETEATLIGPQSTIPLPRYNAMLAVLRNTLYLYVATIVAGRLLLTCHGQLWWNI